MSIYKKLENFTAKAKTQNETIKQVAAQLNALMDAASINTLSASGVILRLQEKRASVGSSTDLEMYVSGSEYDAPQWVCIEVKPCATRSTGYHWGDYSAPFVRPCREDLMLFANAVPALLDVFCAQIEKAENDVNNADMLISEMK